MPGLQGEAGAVTGGAQQISIMKVAVGVTFMGSKRAPERKTGDQQVNMCGTRIWTDSGWHP